jgi:hypothetical protein
VKRFTITDNLTPIAGGRFRIDNGPWIALAPVDGIFNGKVEAVTLISPDGEIVLDPGEHTVDIQAKDAAGNTVKSTVTVTIGDPPLDTLTKMAVPPVSGGDSPAFADLLLASFR